MSTQASRPTYTAKLRKPKNIDWYRTKIPTENFKKLHQRSDAPSRFVQTGSFLAIVIVMGVERVPLSAAWDLVRDDPVHLRQRNREWVHDQCGS